MLGLDDVVYVVDENLLRLGNGLLAVRTDTAVFPRAPIDATPPEGITDPEWIPVVGDRGWVLITAVPDELRAGRCRADVRSTTLRAVLNMAPRTVGKQTGG